MSDRAAHEALVAALLALDPPGEEYAAYRRRLAERIETEPAPSTRRLRIRRFPSKGHVAAAALLLLTGALLISMPQTPEAASASVRLVALSESGRSSARKDSPYTAVVESGLVAIVRTETPFRQRGTTVVPLRIERILKDETRSRPALFCCEFKEEACAGEKYLACISQREQKWVLNTIVRVDGEGRSNFVQGAERCVSFLSASRCDNAAEQYESLLARGVDEPAGCVFTCRPDPRSATALLRKLEELRRDRPVAPVGHMRESILGELARVAEALERLHEPRAALPVAECARRLPPGRRAGLIRLLPGLCVDAPAEVSQRVRRILQEEIDRSGAHLDDIRAASAVLSQKPLAR